MKNYGVKSEISDIALYDFEKVCGQSTNVAYPSEFEIPIASKLNVKNQGELQCCVAEVIAQVAEAQFKEEMSEGYVYGVFRTDGDRYTGMYVSKTLDFWKKISTVPKSYCDLIGEMPEIRAKLKNIPELDNLFTQYKIKGYVSLGYALKEKRENAIKDALYSKDKAYNYGLIATSSNYFNGSNCIWLTGWNDKTNAYKFKNSWGKDYGQNGFSEIPRDSINDGYIVLVEDIALTFNEVNKNDWFYDSVKHLYCAGLMNGTSDTTFEPNTPMTRAEVATLMWRIVKNVDERFKILNKVINEKIE